MTVADAAEQTSSLNEQQEVAVTIYNQDLALVKDLRNVSVKRGSLALAFRDVSARMRPETALLRSVTSPGKLSVLEQNFDYDLLTPQKLLEKYVGRSVSVIKTHPTTGVETVERAQVLAANQGVVLKIGDRIETGVPGRLVFDDVPPNLRDRPTLVMQLDNQGAEQQQMELSYLTGGLSWKADYVVELADKEDQLDISGWVTLNNQSGASYRNAKLQLVAGDVNRVEERMRGVPKPMMAAAPMMDMAKKERFAEESLFEYHLYTLDRPTTIAESQTKQVALLSGAGVPARKELLLQGNDYYYSSSYGDLGQKMKVGVFVEFDNKEASRLGMPLPAGVIRVYKKDRAGNAQFVGEDHIDHTPKNEKIRLKLGEAFDVTADKKQTDFKKVGGNGKYNYIFEAAFEVVLKNAKKEAVTVTVREPMPGDWQVLSESHPHQKTASNTSDWRITVPAEGSTTLKYRALVRY
ncbi:DUF4139 domain-containing protein [Leeia sp.]|uniref:DUF4139 domain-containing protein n=1 Tax=Leeia sp. TaxID=2884678 RepID=UPI0035B38024